MENHCLLIVMQQEATFCTDSANLFYLYIPFAIKKISKPKKKHFRLWQLSLNFTFVDCHKIRSNQIKLLLYVQKKKTPLLG
jgi:hypothetical protein